jgi:hypothetical protein
VGPLSLSTQTVKAWPISATGSCWVSVRHAADSLLGFYLGCSAGFLVELLFTQYWACFLDSSDSLPVVVPSVDPDGGPLLGYY